MQCEMCGSQEAFYKADIEGSVLNVCKECSTFGTILGHIRIEVNEKRDKKAKKIEKEPEKEIIQSIVNDFADKIRKKRESLGLTQEDFAKKLNEKESIIHKWEIGEFKPSLEAAKKLEKLLGVKLIEEIEEEEKPTQKTASDELTIGDLIKIKKK